MNPFCKYLLITIAITFLSYISNAQDLTVTSGQDLTFAGATYNSITINSNGKVTFNGNITSRTVDIDEDGVMIVNGNLTVEALASPRLTVEGTLIVTGNLTVQSLYGTNVGVDNNGTLVVGGEYSFQGGFGGSGETSSGDVYLSDPDDWGYSGGSADGDITDLIGSDPPVLEEDVLVDFIEDSGYDTNLLPRTDWQGDVSGSETDWDVAGNWASGNVPTSTSNVTISSGLSNYSTLCTSKQYYAWNLTLEDNTELTIPTGSQVTIYGDINIGTNAVLKVYNSNTNPTSFIVHGNVTGDITFEWNYNNSRWWFIGHPISNAQMSSYDDILLTNDETNDYVLYDYQDPDVFTKISKTSYNFSAQSPIKGYLFKVKDDNTPLIMSGTINNSSEYTKTLQTDWQVIANPYPSHYQLPTESGAGTDFEYTSGDVYVTVSTRNSDKVYHTFNSLLGIGSPAEFTGIIAPGQAFYVQTDSPGSIKMRADNRVHSVATQLKSVKKNIESDVLRLKLKNENGLTDEAVIAFIDDEQLGFTRIDSEQRFNDNSVSYIYSIVESKKTVINVLPTVNKDILQTVGVKAQDGRHQLYIDGIESFNEDIEIILEDKLTGVTMNMHKGTLYDFSTEEGEFEERFVLHLKKSQIATSIEEQTENKHTAEGVQIYIENNNRLTIKCDWHIDKKTVAVYSMTGEEVSKDEFVGNNYNKSLRLTSGIYVIRVTGEQSRYQQKVFVR